VDGDKVMIVRRISGRDTATQRIPIIVAGWGEACIKIQKPRFDLSKRGFGYLSLFLAVMIRWNPIPTVIVSCDLR
jgi:hypothetical protein